MRRREFITLLGGAAAASSIARPLSAQAQQSAMPMIGFLNPASPEAYADRTRIFRQGLKETGYIEGENVTIDYRWAGNQIDRLPALAAELVQRRVAVIATFGGPASAFAAKAATTTIPIVFISAEDPVKLGLVASLARPGGNITGINFFAVELVAKRLELLRELLPGAARVAVLVDPGSRSMTDSTVRDVERAAQAIGLQIRIYNASSSREIDAVFVAIERERPDALFVGISSFFTNRRVQLIQLEARYAVPAIYADRLFVEAGGLMSYGASLTDSIRQLGVFTGRILKGAKPADVPVVQATKFELAINAQTARMHGFTVPDKLLATADEVIE
jgi:putative ABC transport system substrate-binding protein